jgi:hypothetical protein
VYIYPKEALELVYVLAKEFTNFAVQILPRMRVL